jgi:hypothetical protein
MDASEATGPTPTPAPGRASRAILAALVAVALLAAAPAAHAITVVGTDGAPAFDPFQRWADRSAMPTPPGKVTIDLDTTTCDGAVACTTSLPPTIWFGPLADRGDFLHELGHQFDYYVMTDASRASFMRIAGVRGPWRTDGANPPHERFAEAYRMCALNPRRPDEGQMGYLYEPTVREHRRACALIQRTGKRPAARTVSKLKNSFGSRAGRPVLNR